MTQLANHLAFVLSKNGVISKEDEPVYVYGAEVLLGYLAVVFTFAIIGLILNSFLMTIIFIVSFSLLRGFAGGYHASSQLRCYICSTAIYLLFLLSILYLPEQIKTIVFICLLFIGNIGLFITAPSQNLVNPKTDEEISTCRKILLILMVCLNIISLITVLIYGINPISYTIGYALSAVSILSIINYIQYYFRRNSHEERT